MKHILTSLMLVFCCFIIQAQNTSQKDEIYNDLIDDVIKKILAGDNTGLLEMADFLDDNTQFTRVHQNGSSKLATPRNIALSVFYYNCHFKDFPFDKKMEGEILYNYLKSKIDSIQYYPTLGRFTDIDVKNVSYPFRLRKNPSPVKKSFKELTSIIKSKKENKHYTDMIPIFWEIGELRTIEAENYLLKCADGKNWGMKACEDKNKVLSGIAFALGNFRSDNVLNKLIELAEKHELYAPEDWLKAISRVSNLDLSIEYRTKDGLAGFYQEIRDSVSNLAEMRDLGYQVFMNHYEMTEMDPIQIAEAIDFEWWIFDNLRLDLIEQKDSRVLYMLSKRFENDIYVYNDRTKEKRSNFFEKYTWASLDFNIQDMLSQLTGVTVELQDKKAWLSSSNDFVFNIALMNFWEKHYQDFVFNDATGLFENSTTEILAPNMVKVYYQNMHTDNDDLALKAYINLINEAPIQVMHMMMDFDMDYITGTLNRSLPMFTRKFLIQQCSLTDYCRKNGISSFPKGDLLKFLDKIRTDDFSFDKQLEYEAELKKKITFENVVAIENYTITYGSRQELISEMVGHVLDLWYTEQVDKIVANEKELKIYLYKATRYNDLGIVGACNHYLRKLIAVRPEQLKLFQEIAANEEDKDIRENALWVINHHLYKAESAEDKSAKINLKEFLEQKSDISKDLLETVNLDTNNVAEMTRFFKAFKQEKNSEVLLKFILIIEKHLTSSMIPEFMQLLDKSDIVVKGYWGGSDSNMKRHTIDFTANANDYIVHFIERLCDHYNPSPRPSLFNNNFVSSSQSGPFFLWNKSQTQDFWKELWKKDSTNCAGWGLKLFINRLQNLKGIKKLDIDELESIVESKHWNEAFHHKYLKNVLQAISCSDLDEIKDSWNIPGFSFSYYIKNCAIESNLTSSMAKRFYPTDFQAVMDWLKKNYGDKKQQIYVGKWVLSMCWDNGFMDSLKLSHHDANRKWVLKTLENYAKNNISDFDKKYAEVYALELKHHKLSLSEQIEELKKLDNEGALERRNQLLDEASFEDVQKNWTNLIPYIKNVSDMQSSLEQNYGLFIISEDYKNTKTLEKIILQNDNLTASYQFMARFIPFKKADGILDHEKVFELLKYGYVDCLVGSSSFIWRDFQSALIFYLSKTWEKDLKAFQEKEYPQIKYNNMEVILNYMVAKGLVPSHKYKPLSFARNEPIKIR